MFASTNLVWELGLVLTVLIGWQFALGEYVGGVVMIALMALMLRFFISRRLEEEGRRERDRRRSRRSEMEGAEAAELARAADLDRRLDRGRAELPLDWLMLYKEILIGFVLAGFIGLLGSDFFNDLFITDAPPVLRTIQNVIVGPIIAVLSFVCSVGNVPLAAVLWSGGISFAGVMSFIFADLIVIPIIAIYRKYYGTPFTIRLVALMVMTMMIAALIVDLLFGLARPDPRDAPDHRGRLRLGRGRLQAVSDDPRRDHLRGAVVAVGASTAEPGAGRGLSHGAAAPAGAQTPRAPSTWRTVCSRIFASDQGDQLTM